MFNPTAQVAELLAEGDSVTMHAGEAAEEQAAEVAAEQRDAEAQASTDSWWLHEGQRRGVRWPEVLIDRADNFMHGRASHFEFFCIDQHQHSVYADFTAEDVRIDLFLSQEGGVHLWSEPRIDVNVGQVTVTYPFPLPSGFFHMDLSVEGRHMMAFEGEVMDSQERAALRHTYWQRSSLNLQLSSSWRN